VEVFAALHEVLRDRGAQFVRPLLTAG
jgi:hypothetical protein